MPQRACEDCGEMADDAKAFCPACGHSFVAEEKRSEESQFQKMDGTMQLGQTMYNQMLSDMGLDLKPSGEAKKAVVVPAATLKPAEQTRAGVSDQQEPPPVARSRRLLIFGIIGTFVVLAVLIVIAAAILLWERA